jgi:hypothetical protein
MGGRGAIGLSFDLVIRRFRGICLYCTRTRIAIVDRKSKFKFVPSEIEMEVTKYVYWQDEEMWLGYLEDYPDYWTQAESESELKENLLDLYKELTSGVIPNVRRVAELEVS